MSPQDEFNCEQYDDPDCFPHYDRQYRPVGPSGINLGHTNREKDLKDIDHDIWSVDYEISVLTRFRKQSSAPKRADIITMDAKHVDKTDADPIAA